MTREGLADLKRVAEAANAKPTDDEFWDDENPLPRMREAIISFRAAANPKVLLELIADNERLTECTAPHPKRGGEPTCRTAFPNDEHLWCRGCLNRAQLEKTDG
jgi:hypothetical protein